MNKQFFQKIYIGLTLTISGIGLFSTSPVFAQDNLVVEFEKTPLFEEANFLPGEGITRWVKVTNNSGQSQRIATEAINVKDPNRLGDVLNLEIKEGGTTLYSKPLSTFFNAGEEFLSNLASNSTTTYDFSVSFYLGAQNPFQGKSLNFDILVGFQGEEGGILPGAGGGVGSYLPPGLTIPEESVRIIVTETSVTIEWVTSYPATSQVIYAKDGESHTLCLTQTEGCALGAPPKYGYERTTPENPLKIISHSITIAGLTPATKYYYRAVSHASLAISQEFTFTTLIPQMISEEESSQKEEGGESSSLASGEENKLEKTGPLAGGVMEGEEGEKAGELSQANGIVTGAEKEPSSTLFGSLLATMGNVFNRENLCLVLFILIIALIVLFFFSDKRKFPEEKKWRWPLALPLLIVLSIILYCFLCPDCLYLIIIFVALFILHLLLWRKLKK